MIDQNLTYLFVRGGDLSSVFAFLRGEKVAFNYSARTDEIRVRLHNIYRLNNLERACRLFGSKTRMKKP